MNVRVKCATAGIALLMGLGTLVSAKRDKPRDPLWEVDLSQYGCQGRPPIPHGPGDVWGFWTYQQGVAFTDQNVIVAYFVVRDVPPHNAEVQQKPSPSDQYRLVAVFLNSDRGELLKKMDWPLPIRANDVAPSFFLPAKNGKFIVYNGDAFVLYSRDFQRVAEDDAHRGWDPITSPSGETVLLQTTLQFAGSWTRFFDLLDTETLGVRNTWKEPAQPGTTDPFLWDERVAWANLLEHSVFFKSPNSEPDRFTGGKAEFCGIEGFLDKSTLAVKACDGDEQLLLVSTNGALLQQIDLGLEQIDGPLVPSRNSRRFAIPTFRWGSAPNGNPSLLRARVFELGNDAPLMQLDVQPHYSGGDNFHTPYGDTRFGWGGLSLSPDGQLLAVKSGPIVQLYGVPKQSDAAACPGTCGRESLGATPQAVEAASAPSLLTQQVLSWLPEDTETVIAANGPFVMHLKKQNSESTVNSEESAREIEETFKSLPLNLLGFESGILEKHFQSREISLALEGSRDFRAPSGLGEALFQGAEIVVFEDDISEDVSSFQSETREKSFGSELIEGFQVVLFQEKREQDIWTTFVAFPKSNIAVVATDRDYLREVLARVKGKLGQRALPTNLPEWNHVPGQAAFWALRHFSRQGAGEDPTSPFAARSAGSLSDPKAVGLTFYLDPAKSPVATVTYLSDGRNILENVNKNLFPIEHELGSKELHIQYRIVGPGAVRGTYDLTQIESRQVFLFVLMGLLGHAIFI